MHTYRKQMPTLDSCPFPFPDLKTNNNLTICFMNIQTFTLTGFFKIEIIINTRFHNYIFGLL